MKKVSIILTDWSVRESYHAIDYLNRQTILRQYYEIIWVEYYDHISAIFKEHADKNNIDKLNNNE